VLPEGEPLELVLEGESVGAVPEPAAAAAAVAVVVELGLAVEP